MSFLKEQGSKKKDETVKIKQPTDENKCFVICCVLVVFMIQKNDFVLRFHLINDDIKRNSGAYCVRPF